MWSATRLTTQRPVPGMRVVWHASVSCLVRLAFGVRLQAVCMLGLSFWSYCWPCPWLGRHSQASQLDSDSHARRHPHPPLQIIAIHGPSLGKSHAPSGSTFTFRNVQRDLTKHKYEGFNFPVTYTLPATGKIEPPRRAAPGPCSRAAARAPRPRIYSRDRNRCCIRRPTGGAASGLSSNRPTTCSCCAHACGGRRRA